MTASRLSCMGLVACAIGGAVALIVIRAQSSPIIIILAAIVVVVVSLILASITEADEDQEALAGSTWKLDWVVLENRSSEVISLSSPDKLWKALVYPGGQVELTRHSPGVGIGGVKVVEAHFIPDINEYADRIIALRDLSQSLYGHTFKKD